MSARGEGRKDYGKTTMMKCCKVLICAVDRALDIVLYLVMCAALFLGVFSIWESRRTYQTADPGIYLPHHSESEDALLFDELHAINPEVIAWLRIDGMPIDYPVTQTDNNEKYINTDAKGQFTLSGSIFLDYRNSPDFSDRVSIIYGHDMEKRRMFGSLSEYADPQVLEEHHSGDLFFGGKNHGIEFFEFILTDAYDDEIYSLDEGPADGELALFVDNLHRKAVTRRHCEIGPDDRLILLSTCTEQITNGRYLLVGKLEEGRAPEQNRMEETPSASGGENERGQRHRLNELPLWTWCVFLVFLIAVTAAMEMIGKREKDRGRKKGEK